MGHRPEICSRFSPPHRGQAFGGRRRWVLTRWVPALALLFLAPQELCAQSFWRDPLPGPSVSLEFSRPSFPERFRQFRSRWPSTGAILLGVRYPLFGPLLVAAELPFAHVSGRASPCPGSTCLGFAHGAILGNPYVGMEIDPLEGLAVVRIGLRVPLQRASYLNTRDRYDNVAARIGNFSELVDRLGAFLPEVTSGRTDFLVAWNVTPVLRLRALAGLDLLYHPDAMGYTHRVERYQLHLQWGAEGLWRLGRARLGVGILARDRRTGVDAFIAPDQRRSFEASTKVAYSLRGWDFGAALRLYHFPTQGFDWEWRVFTLMVERALK